MPRNRASAKSEKYPAVPNKMYFAIGEASKLCGVEQHILRYWEKNFPQLKPVKRSGNRRSYKNGDIYLIRQIKDLLQKQGYTMEGAKRYLAGQEQNTGRQYSVQVLHEVRATLEDILRLLK